MNPLPFDNIQSVAHPRWPFSKAGLVAHMIWFYQRIQKGHGGPAWRTTHSMFYVGTIDSDMLEGPLSAGLIDEATATLYRSRNDWALSVTDPVVRLESYASICRYRPHHYIMRPKMGQVWDGADLYYARAAINRMLGLPYDRPQLLGLWLHDLLGVDGPTYHPWLDWGSQLTVCSGGVGAVYEHVRLMRVAMGKPSWGRLYDGLHVERYYPALFCDSKVLNQPMMLVSSKQKEGRS